MGIVEENERTTETALDCSGELTKSASGFAGLNDTTVCLESKPGLGKFARKWQFEVSKRQTASCLGGLVAVEGVIQQSDLWRHISFDRGAERRFLAEIGVSEKTIITHLLYSFCAGCLTFTDAEALGCDLLVRQLAGCQKLANSLVLHRWASEQADSRIACLYRLNAGLVSEIISATRAARNIQLERLFWRFDDSPPDYIWRGFDTDAPTGVGVNGERCLYAIAGIAHNLLTALRALYLPKEYMELNPRSFQRQLIFLPAEVLNHARRQVVRVHIPANWETWWKRLAMPLKLQVLPLRNNSPSA